MPSSPIETFDRFVVVPATELETMLRWFREVLDCEAVLELHPAKVCPAMERRVGRHESLIAVTAPRAWAARLHLLDKRMDGHNGVLEYFTSDDARKMILVTPQACQAPYRQAL